MQGVRLSRMTTELGEKLFSNITEARRFLQYAQTKITNNDSEAELKDEISGLITHLTEIMTNLNNEAYPT